MHAGSACCDRDEARLGSPVESARTVCCNVAHVDPFLLPGVQSCALHFAYVGPEFSVHTAAFETNHHA